TGPPTKVGPDGDGSRRSTLTTVPAQCQDGAMATIGAAPAASSPGARDALGTGDAVMLDLRTASFAVRMLSAAIARALHLVLRRGWAVGRLTRGGRVVRDVGGPALVRRRLIRAVMALFAIWSTSGAVALTCSVIDRRSRRVGALLAGPMVIQERMRTLSPDRL